MEGKNGERGWRERMVRATSGFASIPEAKTPANAIVCILIRYHCNGFH